MISGKTSPVPRKNFEIACSQHIAVSFILRHCYKTAAAQVVKEVSTQEKRGRITCIFKINSQELKAAWGNFTVYPSSFMLKKTHTQIQSVCKLLARPAFHSCISLHFKITLTRTFFLCFHFPHA